MSSILHKELTGLILKLFYEVYNELGHGFLEKYIKMHCIQN